jgi:hypothetical protein
MCPAAPVICRTLRVMPRMSGSHSSTEHASTPAPVHSHGVTSNSRPPAPSLGSASSSVEGGPKRPSSSSSGVRMPIQYIGGSPARVMNFL